MNSPERIVNKALTPIAEENIHAIGQLVDFLDDLDAPLYGEMYGARTQHSIGKHVRHIIDHYLTFLQALSANGTLDYELRQREVVLEIDQRAARQCLCQIAGKLTNNVSVLAPKSVTMRHNSGGHYLALGTSLERELVFLASHTVHHMAIIGLLAEQAGQQVPSGFGVNPSTLRHWARQEREAQPIADTTGCNNGSARVSM